MKIIFLYYISRSGSTFLCNELSKYKHFMICPEAEILVNNLLVQPNALIKNQLTNYKTLFKSDSKLSNWGLNFDYPASAKTNFELFKSILIKYKNQNNPQAKAIVFKAERLSQLHKELFNLKNKGEDIEFISLVRDIRAIYNSQLNTTNPETKKAFNKNPINCSANWNAFAARHFKQKHQFSISIKYEYLIANTQEAISLIVKSVTNKPLKPDSCNGDLFNRLPSNHQSIHLNINNTPNLSRIDYWKTSLSKRDILLIEISSKKYLNKLDYPLISKPHNMLINYYIFIIQRFNYSIMNLMLKFHFHIKRLFHA